MKLFKYQSYGASIETVAFEPAKYRNGRLALQMLSQMEEGQVGPYGVPTINIPDISPLDESCAFIDENNFPDIGFWFELQGIAEPTGRTAQSGFCTYPEYRFDTTKI